MILVAEVLMVIYGLMYIITGKMTVRGKKEVRGAAARVAGVIMLMPLPLSMGTGFLIGVYESANGREVNFKDWILVFAAIELGILLLCLAVVGVIAATCAEEPEAPPVKLRRADGDPPSLEPETGIRSEPPPPSRIRTLPPE